eukprot:TRINITY_DN44852_c0_g1_i12.p1 TRINITY_DN44852_c0_g1~~TRINITY_DN44852_c0_g1_i12.p1  ORF type:complete len:197 (-),score=20.06 TRINITY_DN44852_c0_g1_i12:431-1021(-)
MVYEKNVTFLLLLLATVCFSVPDFYMNFWADEDKGQCGGLRGIQSAEMGTWTTKIRLDTDGRRGGCLQQFSIYDPYEQLHGLVIKVRFYSDGDAQCDHPGERIIPISTDRNNIKWSTRYRIDTDGRAGGCQQLFIVEGRRDVALDVDFQPDGDAGQCGNWGTHTAKRGSPVQIRLDMDGRAGGCQQRFRLRFIKDK